MCIYHPTKMTKMMKVDFSRYASIRNFALRYNISTGYLHMHTYVSTLHVTIKCQKWQILMIVYHCDFSEPLDVWKH